MKKLILTAALAVSSLFAANAQFNAGVQVALPMGSLGDAVGMGVGIGVGYDFGVSDNLTVGGETGLTYFLPKTYEFFGFEVKTSGMFIPVQGVVKYHLGGVEEGGLYLGGALGMTNAKFTVSAGGESESVSSTELSYAPVIGFKTESGLDIQARYQIISGDGGSSNYLGIKVGMNF